MDPFCSPPPLRWAWGGVPACSDLLGSVPCLGRGTVSLGSALLPSLPPAAHLVPFRLAPPWVAVGQPVCQRASASLFVELAGPTCLLRPLFLPLCPPALVQLRALPLWGLIFILLLAVSVIQSCEPGEWVGPVGGPGRGAHWLQRGPCSLSGGSCFVLCYLFN